ncbi:PEP/pyruvate-binding domain-containing protein [Streptomyces sp. NPDC006393]|uniref:dCTP deaminase domain-containing protein n=1 Tax=Streptomyces sp. NPDC006393 TaxID=3156763 RepID=UPI00340137C4
MILTGPEIEREWANGRITIDPFTPEQVNPNSYNFRLGRTLRVYSGEELDARRANAYEEIEIPDEGYVLQPGHLYLAHTVEVLGSEHYAPTFAARSSIARLGLFINLSASLGDIGYTGQWTLQLYTMNRVRVYAGINIGQMMWWHPQGEVVLYDGKYQGAVGPRPSDIHIDFDRQFARQRLPGLRAGVDAADVGPKFAALVRNCRDFPVPDAFCVPAARFAAALTDEQRARLAAGMTDLRATVGAFFTESLSAVRAAAAGLRMPDEDRALLRTRLTDVFGADADRLELAVRSSGLDEDRAASSLAGVHRTVLGVRGADAVIAAVEECWRSYYAPEAVAARVREGDFGADPRLAVIVQRQIRPHYAGVAFTGLDGTSDDRVSIEYVEGLADELVAGAAVPRTADSASLHDGHGPADPAERRILDDVTALARDLTVRHGRPVDVEWAADDDGVHLIQVRPLTAARRQDTSDAPHAEAHRLYFDELPEGFGLGRVAAVHTGFVAKRGPTHRLARTCGVSVGGAWVVRFNGRGLHDPDTAGALVRTLTDSGAPERVLDLSDTLRQIVVPADDVVDRLALATGATPTGTELHTAVVRDFIRGDLGVISRTAGDGLVVEYSAEGLMALNRGTSGAEAITVADTRRPLDAPGNTTVPPGGRALLPHLHEIARFTAAMDGVHGPCTLEWVHADGRLYFVDHSALGGHDDVTVTASGVCLSSGTARGPLLRLTDDTTLRRLSIGPAVSIDRSTDVGAHESLARISERIAACPGKPVVHASRPYAVLSVLIGHVAGFVFEQGAALSHLAILLRESGTPAAVAPQLAADAAEAVISDGTVVTVGRKEI